MLFWLPEPAEPVVEEDVAEAQAPPTTGGEPEAAEDVIAEESRSSEGEDKDAPAAAPASQSIEAPEDDNAASQTRALAPPAEVVPEKDENVVEPAPAHSEEEEQKGVASEEKTEGMYIRRGSVGLSCVLHGF